MTELQKTFESYGLEGSNNDDSNDLHKQSLVGKANNSDSDSYSKALENPNKDKYDSFSEALRCSEKIIKKENDRKRKWNAYMRNYNARKKKEREERMNQVIISFNNTIESYPRECVIASLRSIIGTYTTILNNNIDKIPVEIIDDINLIFSSNNILDYINYLDRIVKQLIDM